MSVINAVPLLAAAGGDYTISRSVRLRSSASAYFNRTFGAPTSGTTWTWSGWIKRGKVSSGYQRFFGHLYVSAPTNNQNYVGFNSDDTLEFEMYTAGAYTARLVTTQVFRDPSAWYHIVAVWNTSDATSSNRLKLYVNGQQITSFSTATYPSQNQTGFINQNGTGVGIGVDYPYNNSFFDGYLTEINFIDGQALTPSSFGETDAVTGVWKPKKYAGTYGTNGFYLNFSDNSNNTATTIGKDYSGNGNNWTPNNISVTSGSTYDSMLDVPTPYADGGNGRGNYAVLNPLFAAGTVSDGNLKHTASTTTWVNTSSTIFVSSGKWYFEATNIAGNYTMIGVATNSASTSQNYATATNTWTYFNDGTKYGNGATATAYGASYTTGNVIGVALDMDAGTLTFYKDGVSQGTAFSTGLAGLSLCPWFGSYTSGNGVNVNFGQRPFAYTPPSGFKALNTQNLPEPTIKNGKQNFDVLTYAGSASSQTISGLNFQPDLIWFKERTTAGIDHFLVDSVRSSYGLRLYSNSTAAEASTAAVTSVTSTGYTLAGGGSNTNDAFGRTYVTWNWKAGGSSSSNTSGSITSTVSANTTAGFSIVTYTGIAGNVAKTFGHGLGVAPSMVIVKGRDAGSTGVNDWVVWHSAFTGSEYIYLDLTNAKGTSANYWGATVPSSTVVTVGGNSSNVSNESGIKYVAYCFAEVAGFSKLGSYQGNGSSDGPFVFCGFRPRWIMVKSSTSVQDWKLLDTSRNPYNSTNSLLGANISAAEDTNTAYDFDILSNGFKPRNTFGYANTNGATYIFAAFAENPFKYALAR